MALASNSLLTVVALSAFAHAASGEILVASSQSVFDALVVDLGGSVVGQSFASYNGFYASGVGGGSGDAAWTASASGGLYADAGIFSTNNPDQVLTFNFSSANVFAIAGNFFNTNPDFSTGPGLVKVVAGGVSFIVSSSPSSFAGFVSTSGAISSISVVPFDGAAAGKFASTNSLSIGVIPAPGAVALMGVAGLLARRRRA